MHLAKKGLKYEAVWICEESWSLYLKNHELFHGHLGNNMIIICSAFVNSIIWQKGHPLATIYLKIDFRGVVLACMLGLFLCCWEKRFHYGDFSNVLYMLWRKTRTRRPYNVKILFPFFLLGLEMKWRVPPTAMVEVYVVLNVLACLFGLSKHKQRKSHCRPVK